jgi:HAD superfamily hydrolase (TIGR01490 family)
MRGTLDFCPRAKPSILGARAQRENPEVSLAIFDLDNTLLDGDSDYAWGQYLVDKHIVDGKTYRQENERYYAAYRDGTLDIYAFLAFSLHPLASHPRAQLEKWRADFMQTRILPMIPEASRRLVAQHRDAGDTLLIITATNRFVTEPIALEFGIPHLLATDPEMRDGEYTGGVSGVPCFREGKVERLQAWLEQHGQTLENACFYSDSHNDLPLLNLVDRPVAVNPDEELARVASDNQWPVLNLH